MACPLLAEPSVDDLRSKAEKGDVEAQVELGRIYQDGNGVAKDDAEATKWYLMAANQGRDFAQFELGYMYEKGAGVSKDASEAAKWYRKAADQGYVYAQFTLGNLYLDGIGVPKDAAEAVKWYRKAADQDYADAQFNLGNHYWNGIGVTKNVAEALKWYRKAADKGDAGAQVNLGSMYRDGIGVTKDIAEALNWYHKADDQGNVDAQFELGRTYRRGEGVPRDGVEAAKWYRKAADQGDPDAQYLLGDLYWDGDGVPKDEIEGLAWTYIAVATGKRDEFVNGRSFMESRLSSNAAIAAQQRAKEIAKQIEANKARMKSDGHSFRGTVNAQDIPKSSGSGTIVSGQGHILTAAHVVAGAMRLAAVTANGIRNAMILQIDEANDVAVLKIEGGPYVPLLIAPSGGVRLGQAVATIGFPNVQIQGFSPKVTRGEISSVNGSADDPREWQISVPVQPGNSGGPLLDDSGNLIGVVEAKHGLKAAQVTGDIPQNVNYAVKSAYALALFEPYLDKNSPQPNPSNSKQSFEDMVAKAKESVVLILVY